MDRIPNGFVPLVNKLELLFATDTFCVTRALRSSQKWLDFGKYENKLDFKKKYLEYHLIDWINFVDKSSVELLITLLRVTKIQFGYLTSKQIFRILHSFLALKLQISENYNRIHWKNLDNAIDFTKDIFIV